jgi:hypothetical protein
MWIVRQQICLCSERYDATSGVLYFEFLPKDFYQYEEFALVSFLLIKAKLYECLQCQETACIVYSAYES